MPRKYVRKTDINAYSAQTLDEALNAIRNDGRKIRAVGRAYGIPESTLRKKLQHDEPKTLCLGRKAIFFQEVERHLEEYVLTLAKLYYGITPKQLRHLAFKYAEANGIEHAFNRESQLAGKAWLYGFLNRHPQISLRQPEGTSLNRIAAFNLEETKLFFQNLESVFLKCTLEGHRIFNMDETGITTVQKKCPKVYCKKGVKQIGTATSGERGRTITGVFCMSAAGNYIPPMLIYPRTRMAPALQKNGPVGTNYQCSKNGWINADLYLNWLHHFVKHAKPSAEDPVLLILDNHSSHISIESYNFCKTNYIHVVSLPPHTSHRLQPLDLTFFGPLKNTLYREYDIYLTATGHKKITEYDIAELLNKAFMKVATMQNAASGFRSAGIFPFNPTKFDEDDFAAAHELGSFSVEASSESNTNSALPRATHPATPEPQAESQIDQEAQMDQENQLSVSNVVREPLPCSSKSYNLFFEFAPISKNKPKPVKKISRSKQHSKILTSTPMKYILKEAQEKRKTTKVKKDVKPKGSKGTKSDATKRRIVESEEVQKRRKKKKQESESSFDDIEENNLCDDDSLDDVDEIDYFIPTPRQSEGENDPCGICGEPGKNELWYRCVMCGLWNHADCTGVDSPKNYICDFCKH